MIHVRIFNPETRGIDSTVLRVSEFTVPAVFAALEARKWNFQPGTYVAFKVEPENTLEIAAYWDSVLTFTVEEHEHVVTERVVTRTAVPA